MTTRHPSRPRPRRLAFALSFAIASVAGVASAQAPAAPAAAAPAPLRVLPADLPPYDADRPLPALDLRERRLDNGLTVWVLPRADGLPKVHYVLAVRGGLAHDPAATPAMSNLLAGLLSEGTASRSSVQIAEELQAMGASLGASASSDGVVVSASGLASAAAPLSTLFADVVRRPTFPEGEVALARANALQALKAQEAQPGFQASRAMARVLYGDHPYANQLPTEASIAATDVATLRAAHGARFRPGQALLVIAGRVEADTAFDIAEAAFGDWTGAGPALAALPPAPAAAGPRFVLVPRADSVQSSVRIGRPAFAAGDAREIPAALASTILGGGFDSRLMGNLREDKGYTYGASSGFGLRRAGGAFQASADVRNEVTGAAIGEFMKEFEAMRTSPVPADELARAKRYTAGTYLFQNQLQGAVASALAGNWLLGRPADYLSTYVARTGAVTAAQVQAVAEAFFAPAAQSIVVVGDAAVAEQLAPYGTFGSGD